MSNHETTEAGGHNRKKQAAVVIAGLGAASAAAYSVLRKRRAWLNTRDGRSIKEIDTVFSNPDLLYEERTLMARTAVRVLYASTETARGIVTKAELLQVLGAPLQSLERALERLETGGLITTPEEEIYSATPDLVFLANEGTGPYLPDAQLELGNLLSAIDLSNGS